MYLFNENLNISGNSYVCNLLLKTLFHILSVWHYGESEFYLYLDIKFDYFMPHYLRY